MSERWRIQLVGQLRATRGPLVVDRFRTRKAAGLLGYLAYFLGRPHEREELVATFWPDAPPGSGRNSLSQALSTLRHQLEPPGVEPGSVIVATRATVGLDPRAVTTDVAELLAGGTDLPGGELLPGHHEEWLGPERDRVRARVVSAARRLATEAVAAGRPEEALAALRRAVAADPLAEEAHRELMRLLESSGEPLAALRHYDELVARLDRELHEAPTAPTRALALEIGHRVEGRSELPAALAPCFGREAELATLTALLDEGRRLVTIVGPGGVGKTRLALEAVERRPGARFVPLADVTDARDLAAAVARSLGLAPHGDPLEALAACAGLLVLDNLEQVADAGSVVKALLDRAPALACVVTSRRRLGVSGEREVPLGPLALPLEGDHGSLAATASVRLFVDRVRAHRPSFELSPANVNAVAALVRRLEGIPLALVLAAGRAHVLSPAQLIERLGTGLDAPSRDRDLPARHGTMRAAIEWSHRLLDPATRRVFAQLSVFRGGFSLESAEAVLEDPLLLDRLGDLCECSLLSFEEGPPPRFRVLEVLRAFADEQLEPGERAAVRVRHARHFLALVEGLAGAPELAYLEQVAREYENVRAALAASREDPDLADVGLALVGALRYYWQTRGPFAEGRAAAGEALARSRDAGFPRARALLAAGVLAWRQSDAAAARAWVEESIALGRSLGAEDLVARALVNLGNVFLLVGDHARAGAAYEEGARIADRLALDTVAATATVNLGMIAEQEGRFRAAHAAYELMLARERRLGAGLGAIETLRCLGRIELSLGELAAGRAHLEEALAPARAAGYLVEVGWCLALLARARSHEGDHARARELADESVATFARRGAPRPLAVARAIHGEVLLRAGVDARTTLEALPAAFRAAKDSPALANALRLLAEASLAAGDADAARAHLREALAAIREGHGRGGAAELLETAAALEPCGRRTAELLGAAAALRRALPKPLPPADRERVERIATRARALAGDGFEGAWRAGTALDWRAAIERAAAPPDAR